MVRAEASRIAVFIPAFSNNLLYLADKINGIERFVRFCPNDLRVGFAALQQADHSLESCLD